MKILAARRLQSNHRGNWYNDVDADGHKVLELGHPSRFGRATLKDGYVVIEFGKTPRKTETISYKISDVLGFNRANDTLDHNGYVRITKKLHDWLTR